MDNPCIIEPSNYNEGCVVTLELPPNAPPQIKSAMMEKPFRIVTMCQGGHVRSVALKYLLKYEHGHDVIACGWESNPLSTREMLFEWADFIVIMQPEFVRYVPKEYHNHGDGTRKLFCYDVGNDRFHNPFHSELQKMLRSMIVRHKLFL